MVDYEGEGREMPDFKSLEKSINPELPPWAVRQKKVFTSWINNKVSSRSLKVEDLFLDLSDGVILYNLLEVLSRQSLAVLGKIKPEKNKIKKIANMNIVWKYLGNTVRLVGIGPTDIVDGNSNLTLGMIWSLIVFFMAKDLGDGGEDLQALKRRLMEWLKARTRGHSDIDISNFTDSLADGKAFMAVMESALSLQDISLICSGKKSPIIFSDPNYSPYSPSDNPRENLRRAFQDAEKLFGVGSILDPDDPACCSDEKANITYLAELMKVRPEIPLESTIEIADPRDYALDYANRNLDKSIENLRDLCKVKPDDADGAIAKVAELMNKAGLQNINVVDNDSVTTKSPFIFGERSGPPGSPTVLLYSTYATPEDSEIEAAQWYCDPFDGKVEDGRIYAKGAFQDKANVVGPLAAVEALLSSPTVSGLPCNIRVLVGGTPPPASLQGDTPIELANFLTEFLRGHPDIVGTPDFVVVSNPGGSPLTPDHANVGFSCRGFASIDVSVRTFNPPRKSDGKYPPCCTYGGPLIDPGCVLSSLISSFRDLKTGMLLIDALKVNPDKITCDKLKGIHYGEHNARFQTGYCKEVPCAKEFYDIDGVSTLATIVEQLTLLPAVTVASIKMTIDKDNGPLTAEFSPVAEASIHLCLAPDQDVSNAIRAFKQHCKNLVPFGVDVQFSDYKGHKGWMTHPSSKIVEALLASRQLSDSHRSTIAVGSPNFEPIPCAFADALPESKVISFGVNESESNAGVSNESISIDDFTDSIKTTIDLLYYLSDGPPKPKSRRFSGTGSAPGSPSDPQNKYLSSVADLDKRQGANKLRMSLSPVAKRPVSLEPQRGRSSSISRLPMAQNPVSIPGSFYHSASPSRLAVKPSNSSKTNVEEAFRPSPPPVPSRQTKLSNSLDFHNLSSRVFQEINKVRANPAEYSVQQLEPLIVCYSNGGVFTSPNGSQRVTSEGVKALEDAILVLKRTEPVPQLERLSELDCASKDHAKDLSTSGLTSHVGSDGSRAAERMSRYGQFVQVAGEMIALYENDPAGIVCQMLINDGEKSRQNRKSILGAHFKVCGLASMPHPKVGTVTVVTLAGGWKAKSLDRPAFVTIAPGESPSSEFSKVLDSIPVPQIIEETNKAISEGNTVEIEYKPGEVKLTVKFPDGSSQLLSCQWS